LAPINPLRENQDGSDVKKAVVSASAEFGPPNADGVAVLSVTAKMAKDWHIYSLTQAKGGPIPTKIKLDESKEFKAHGDFKPTKPPEVHEYPKAWKGLKVEEHHGSVTWKGIVELTSGVDPARLEIKGAVYAQACAEQCLAPKSYRFVARLNAKGEKSDRKVAARRENVWPPTAAKGRDDIKLVADQQVLDDLPQLPLDASGKDANVIPGSLVSDSSASTYRSSEVEATITGRLEPSVVAPGGTANLILSVAPNPGWYIYAYSDRPTSGGQARPTLIHVTDAAGLTPGEPVASASPKSKQSPSGDGQSLIHDRRVEWTIPFTVPPDAAGGTRKIEGLIGLLTCSDVTCLFPHGVRFTGTLTVADQPSRDGAALAFAKASYSAVAKAKLGESALPTTTQPPAPIAMAPRGSDAPGDGIAGALALPIFDPQNLSAPSSLVAILGLSVLGGLLLNLMPCVLPVIGLKILAFVEQGGRQRSHVLALNLWYSAGILSVFLILATLAAFLNVGWGEQFQSTGFNVAMAALVFVMALSFLGVWEIPIPGFAGSSAATKLAHSEGFLGAFSKGVLTTVLATPCSGPFLGTVFGFTLKQPPHVIYLIFTAIGLGMALPYLLIGAFPRLIRFLPKPGAWMDTFKQVMGFVLLGTVVFLFTFMERDYVVPTFALLAVLWAACWWINRTPLTADAGRRLLAWGQAALFAGIVGYFSFTMLLPRPTVLRWEPFTIASWNKHTAAGKTVLVDFTADWCLNCKLNMTVAIDTDAVRRVAEENNVVPLLADYSDMSEEIKQMLEALGSRSIPVLAVFPAGEPTRPIVLRDLLTRGQVIEALRQAGPSKAADANSLAMRERME
jgi:cytochrome c biogenesis protein CcdA/DsbC/DsbD-like thiol-disulfide interchange protein